MLSPFSWGVQWQILPLTKTPQPRRAQTRPQKQYQLLLDRLLLNIDRPTYSASCRTEIDWKSVPPQIDPANFMKKGRALRKRQQIENMVGAFGWLLSHLRRSQHDGLLVVDFCSGSGHLGFVFAHLFPASHIILVEKNPTAAQTARHRKLDGAFSNVTVFEGKIQEWDREFDVGIGVHACGILSDWIQRHCIMYNAAYIMCPCCVGKVKNFENSSSTENIPHLSSECKDSLPRIEFPHSKMFQSVISKDEYFDLAVSADYSGLEMTENSRRRRLCKAMMEHDRNMYAEEFGYTTSLKKMDPINCTPKNDILIGLKDKIHQDVS